MKQLLIILVAAVAFGWAGNVYAACSNTSLGNGATCVEAVILNCDGTSACVPAITASLLNDTFIVGITFADGSLPTLTSVVDNASGGSDAFSVALSEPAFNANWSAFTYYASAVKAGTTTITVTLSGAASVFVVTVIHLRGFQATPFDTSTAAKSASGSAVSVGPSATTAVANEYAFCDISHGSATTTAGSGFTVETTDSGSHADSMDKVLVATGAVTCTATLNNTVLWDAQLTTWKITPPPLPHTGGQLISAPLFPQATPSAVYPPDTGYTLTAVASGSNLQTAINAAACGTKLNLAHDGTFTASLYTLPNNSCACHTDPTKYIIIQSDAFEANYTPGVRTDPSVQYHTVYPHISGSDTNYTFTANTNGASCWGFAGVDITNTFDGANAVLSLGDGSLTVANFPHDFPIWGSYIHGQASKGLTRCVMFNGNWGGVIDSYLSDCHKVGQDSQAVEMWDGLGPLLSQNSFLEGAAENILIGGSDPHAGVIPSDFTLQRNHLFKPLSWRVADPSYVGIHWNVKNCFELKDAQRVLITGNVFENGWGDGQSGQCVTWNSANQGGNDPQAVIADINMYLNVIRHFTQVYQIGGNTNPTYQSDHRISIHDNLSWDIDVCIWDNCHQTQIPDISLGGRNNGTLYATYDLSINHETTASRDGQNQGGAINFQPTDSTPYYGFNVTNSILNNGVFGAFFRTAGSGDAIMPSLTPGGHANNNCIFGSLASGYNNAIFNGKQLVTAGQSGVFVNPGVDFHVATASLCHNAASDGTDMGANIDAVNAATAGVVQTLANLHTVTNVSPSTFTHLGSTSITITGTNFISGAAEVIVGGAGPAVAVSTDICAVNTCTVVTSAPITLAVNDTVNMAGMVNGLFLNSNQGQFLVASVTDTTHFTYTDNGIGTQSWLGGTANRITPGNACASVVVVNSTTITCTTPAATGTVTNGPVSVFVSQFGIPVQSTVYGAYN